MQLMCIPKYESGMEFATSYVLEKSFDGKVQYHVCQRSCLNVNEKNHIQYYCKIAGC